MGPPGSGKTTAARSYADDLNQGEMLAVHVHDLAGMQAEQVRLKLRRLVESRPRGVLAIHSARRP
ncbi:AAA family ATPase [Mycobacteroides abscessus]|uniref:AAA family ATPase n=1 Tax=Mycobacteroides abscessus TaxID=36809 RepID=UPI0013F63B90